MRTRIQGFIDRRFYRHKYDAAKTVESFAGHLRSEVNLEALTSQLIAVLEKTMQPAHVSVWRKR